MRRANVKALLLTSFLATGSAAAQEASEVLLDATYLGGPTDWCPATAGVPLVVKMDGPDIIQGPQGWPRTVRERVGGRLRIVHDGGNTGSFWREEDVDFSVIGRFSAEFRTCHSLWGTPHVTGGWHLIGNDGSDMGSGEFDDVSVFSFDLPFFRSVPGPSSTHYAEFGDRKLFIAGQPETTITQTF